MSHYAIGLDYGTNSVRAILVDTQNGEELATSVWNYAHGENGVIIDPKDPNLARQHPRDYVDGIQATISDALRKASAKPGFAAANVIGIGVDTTGSTPIPVDAEGTPLAFSDKYDRNPAAMAWLWKDHTAFAEAQEITELARKLRPNYLAKCGGIYSSEWFWAKLLHCKRTSPEVFEAAYTWVEFTDWVPAVLAGTTHPSSVKRGICAAGHKAFYNSAWGGYPETEFLTKLDQALVRVRKTLPEKAYTIKDAAGSLSPEWAKRLGLPAGIPVAVGAFDAHIGGIGSGISPASSSRTSEPRPAI